MLANGRTRPTLFPNIHSTISSSADSSNSSLQFTQTSKSIAPRTDVLDNGLEAGFPLPMASSSGKASKAGTPVLNIPSSVHNNQLPNMLDQATGNIHSSSINQPNPNSASMTMIPGEASTPGMPPSTQYNLFNSRQELLMHGFQAGSRHEISNPTMRGAPNASEQYGSLQQRSYISASNESQIRSLNRQTPSPFSSNFFPQESHNTQTASRVASSTSEDRTLSSGEHFQWQQPKHRYQTTLSSNPSPVQSTSRSPMQQPSMPPRQPPPYMMMGSQHQAAQAPPQPSQQQQQQPYMMQSQMKTNSLSPQQYYGGMSNMVGHGSMSRQQAMGNHLTKPGQDYGSYQQHQQQQYQHFSQSHGQYSPQMPAYMQSRQAQQQIAQSPSSMSRMMTSHQPILPKPSSDMFSPSCYPNSIPDSPMDFPSSSVNDHVQQQPHHVRTQQPSYPSPGGIGQPSDNPAVRSVNQGTYQRGYYAGYPSSPSPNITMGSPLRSMPEAGFQPSNPSPLSAPPALPGPSTPTYPSTPPLVVPPFSSSSTLSTHGGGAAAAAAAAAVMAAASSLSRYPSLGQSQAEQSPHGYGGSHDVISSSRGQIVPSPRSGTPSLPTPGLSGMENTPGGSNVETGHVPSPTLNMLPTAEDVEAMIQSMRTKDACLDSTTPSSQSCPTPTAPSSSSILSPCPSQSLAYSHSTEHSGTSDSRGTSVAAKTQNMVHTNNTSPMSSFSEQFSGVPSPGVSISSSFGDDGEEMNVPVDDITPTLGQTPVLLATQKLDSKQTLQYGKYSQLYELSDDPERKEFLDKYAAFMESTGNSVRQIPVVGNQPLDLFKLYKIIRENGGLQEVIKRKLWDKVMVFINIPPQHASLSSHLRSHYTRFLLAYEMHELGSRSSVDNLLEESGIPPPNATVTCSESIFPLPTVSASNQSGAAHLAAYNQTNGPQTYNNTSYRHNDGYFDSSYESSKNYSSGDEARLPMATVSTPPSNSYNMPPYSFGNEGSSYPNYPNRSFPSHNSPAMQFPGSAALSKLLQRTQQSTMQGYPQHPLAQRRQSLMGQQQTQHGISQQEPVYPMWGSQYNASSEPEHMFDYPPNGPSTQSMRPSMAQHHYPPTSSFNSFSNRQQAQFPSSTQQYHPSTPPHGALSSPSPRQPMTSQQQQQQQQQQQHPVQKPKFQTHHTKKDVFFPLDSIEATKPVFTKKRKLTSRDLGPVEAWRVMMSLKSGLLSETTWALDTLNILLYDDHTVGYFLLSHLPGLLDNLIDHFRRYLMEIFGSFWENEEQTCLQSNTTSENGEKMKNEKSDDKLEKDVCRSLTAFIAASAIEHAGLASEPEEWLLGASNTTIHIQTHLGTAVSPKRPRQFATQGQQQISHETQFDETHCKLESPQPLVALMAEPCEQLNCQVNVKQENKKIPKDCSVKCCTDKVQVKNEIFVTNSNEWDVDSDDSDSSSGLDEGPTKCSSIEAHKNDYCLTSKEEFTSKLKKELDLDIESLSEDSETTAYIQSIIETKVERRKKSPAVEEESVRQEDAPLSLRTESDDAISRRCMCVSNILRGLSFVPGNDVEMFKHSGLLLILGKLLLLCHNHAQRVAYRHSYMHDDIEVDAPSDDRHDWWRHSLEVLRENALVILSNIAGQLDLSVYPKTISTPILDGLLHWFVCQSAEAVDPMPTATFGTSLSAQQLVLESLAKMSILGGNAELILSTPPTSRTEALYATLVRLLGQRENPVSRELTLVVLSNLSQSDSDFVCLVEKKQCIAMLLQFIEDAANSINAYSSGGSLAQAGFHSEDFCGTSVDMLRRAASSLVSLARCKPIRSLFLPYQERLLILTTLKLLERMIGTQLADVLYYLSR